MRLPALPAGRYGDCRPVRELVFRGGHFLDCGLRRLQAGQLAVAAVHGCHDLRGSHRLAYSGTKRTSIIYLRNR